MSDTDPTGVLPEELSSALRSAYQEYRNTPDRGKNLKAAQYLAALARNGYDQGWPIRLLAEHCHLDQKNARGVTPERLRQIMHDFQPARRPPRLPKFPRFERPERQRSERRPRAKRAELTKKQAKELRDLTAIARQNTGSRPLDSEYRTASKKLSALIMEYHDKGVIWDDLAEASGLSASGVRMRAARHGYGKGAPPSVTGYKDVMIHPPSRKKEDVEKVKQKATTTTARKRRKGKVA